MFKPTIITSLFLGLLMAAQPALPATAEQAQPQPSRIAKLLQNRGFQVAAGGLAIILGMNFVLQKKLDYLHEKHWDRFAKEVKNGTDPLLLEQGLTEKGFFSRRTVSLNKDESLYIRTHIFKGNLFLYDNHKGHTIWSWDSFKKEIYA